MGWRCCESKLLDATGRVAPRIGELILDCAEAGEMLSHRLHRHKPAEPLSSVDQTFITNDFKRPTNRDPAHLKLRRELGLTGEHRSWSRVAQSGAHRIGDF